MSQLEINQIDADGAVREHAEHAVDSLEEGDTRLDFIRKAGLAGGAAIGGGALLGSLTEPAFAAKRNGRPPKSFGKGDVGILNYALTLEYLEAAFYTEAKKNNDSSAFITDPQTLVFLDTVEADERAHVRALKDALGKKAVKKPKFDFGDTTSTLEGFVGTAVALENTGVSAYAGQALNIKDPATVAAAVSIITIEARHASVIGLIQNQSREGIAPDGPFDKPLTARKVLKIVESTGFIQD